MQVPGFQSSPPAALAFRREPRDRLGGAIGSRKECSCPRALGGEALNAARRARRSHRARDEAILVGAMVQAARSPRAWDLLPGERDLGNAASRASWRACPRGSSHHALGLVHVAVDAGGARVRPGRGTIACGSSRGTPRTSPRDPPRPRRHRRAPRHGETTTGNRHAAVELDDVAPAVAPVGEDVVAALPGDASGIHGRLADLDQLQNQVAWHTSPTPRAHGHLQGSNERVRLPPHLMPPRNHRYPAADP